MTVIKVESMNCSQDNFKEIKVIMCTYVNRKFNF